MLSWIKKNMEWTLGLLVVISVLLLSALINSGISNEIALKEQRAQRREIAVLQNLLLESSKKMRRSEIEQIIETRFGEGYFKKENQDELLLYGDIILKFEGNSLVEVKSLDK
ncbi:MAG: hypothetical protein ABIJ24_06545 [Nitrospinota bacterium]|nr:hypothetical protein [Nitrospinota bacterium]